MTVRVDWRAAASLVGTIVKWLAVALLAPIAVALSYGEDPVPFVATAAVAVAVGVGLERLDPDPDLGIREGFLMVTATWLAVAVVGMLPYVIAGGAGASTLADPVNALFESMSGFTTTGATVMGDISTDRHSRAVLLWRQLTQWLGGMGIVVLAVAILPQLSVGGAQLMAAEAPGPGMEKLTPRIAQTARALWGVYVALTVVEAALLYGLHLAGMAPNMDLYNAVAHALTTLPTGGFSPQSRSIEAFSAAVQWAIIPFMVAAGANFALFWRMLVNDRRALITDAEFRFYATVLAALSLVVAVLLFVGSSFGDTAAGASLAAIEPAVRHGTFQVVSIVTTTGYATVDFNAWPSVVQYLLFVGMFVGGSAGSTGSAIKMVRVLVVVKSLGRELFTTIHPEAIRPVRLGGRALDERVVRGIHAFVLLYAALFVVATAVVFVDAHRIGLDLTALEAMSAVAATLGNVGPGFGVVGPMNSYLPFSDGTKLTMVVLMLAGRLEILPVLVLLTGEYWES